MSLTLNDFIKLSASIKNRMFMMLARGIVKAIKNTEGTQKLQIVALADETIGDIERLQEYGLETFPDVDAEAFAAFIGGNREIGVVLVTHDRRYRPKTLVSGEVMLYTKFLQTFHLNKDGAIVATSSDIKLGSDAAIRKLIDERIVAKLNTFISNEYSLHTHPYLDTPVGPSVTSAPSVPGTALVLADFSTTKTKAE